MDSRVKVNIINKQFIIKKGNLERHIFSNLERSNKFKMLSLERHRRDDIIMVTNVVMRVKFRILVTVKDCYVVEDY